MRLGKCINIFVSFIVYSETQTNLLIPHFCKLFIWGSSNYYVQN
ncbi:unnamed protein product [Chironomus riparius]|uniref:Uncharacterized protein n=1 Tax=Chironomus riparius TaxID=315576 RepID=A0A9N9RGZ2_9DIPT|nr:unnamed protein product [Chironomus riparius]